MSPRVHPLLGACLALALAACAGTTHPLSLQDAVAASQSKQATVASVLAPLAFAEAESLLKSAKEADARGDSTTASILADSSIAAVQRAVALARTIRAQRALDEATQGQAASTLEQAKITEELQRDEAATADAEMQLKVVTDAEPLYAIAPSSNAEREKARRELAMSLSAEAKLLCATARLVTSAPPAIVDAEALVTSLEQALAQPPPAPAPMESAMRARAACLSSLTLARRPQAQSSSRDRADALLSAVSQAGGFSPSRVDSGVQVTLTRPFQGADLSKDAATKLSTLGKLASSYPEPLLVIVHDADVPKDAVERDARRGELVKQALLKAGATHVEVIQEGISRPVISPGDKREAKKNERVDVIFVDAGG